MHLRVTSENGATYDDPSEDLLFELLAEVERGESEFLIVERTTDPSGQTYIQTVRNPDGTYLVERREGDPSRHFGTTAADHRSAHQLLTDWSFELFRDTHHTWTKLDFPG
ncbi:hypothetical protein [Kribbella sp. NPDC051770]|uniref:hypothetical protein n=1 Tax=Kribbella sp. NPDC051770 TaxID=3155413 RepID=UPI0034490B93